MTPDGPRLIHPVTYSRGTLGPSGWLNTRPARLGMTARASSNGTPGTALPRYPTDWNTKPVGMDSDSKPSWARTEPSSVRTSRFRPMCTAFTAPSPANRTGEARYLNTMRLAAPEGARAESSCAKWALVRIAGSAPGWANCWLVSPSGAASRGSMTTSTPDRSSNAISSGLVYAAWAGPRRPSIATSRILLRRNADSA